MLAYILNGVEQDPKSDDGVATYKFSKSALVMYYPLMMNGQMS